LIKVPTAQLVQAVGSLGIEQVKHEGSQKSQVRVRLFQAIPSGQKHIPLIRLIKSFEHEVHPKGLSGTAQVKQVGLQGRQTPSALAAPSTQTQAPPIPNLSGSVQVKHDKGLPGERQVAQAGSQRL
jgi:hypothetical protein